MALRRPGTLVVDASLSPENILKRINSARGRSKFNLELPPPSERCPSRKPGGLRLSPDFNSSGNQSPEFSSPSSTGSRERNPSDTSVGERGCSCNRSPSYIQCKACGHVFKGRVRGICHEHPNVIHLMDSYACPNCKAEMLKEFAGGDQDFIHHGVRTS